MAKRRKCTDGWLNTYLRYTQGIESPELFHLWCGIFAISASLGRNVYHNMGYFDVYPNMYLVLVAPSGVKKSTAGNIAIKGIFKKAKIQSVTPEMITSITSGTVPDQFKHVPIVTGKITMPKLIQDISDYSLVSGESRCIVYASEFKVFTNPNMSNNSLLEDMTEIYEPQDEFPYKTKTAGSVLCKNNCIGMLGCSTPEWLTNAGGKDFINSGFSARVLYVRKESSERCFSRPKKPQGWEKMEADLIEDLQDISRLTGEYSISPDADKIYDEWYNDSVNFTFDDERLQPYSERKSIHMLKLAIVLRAQMDNVMIIEKEQILESIKLVEGLEEGMLEVYKSVSYHDFENYANIIAAKLLKHNGCTLNELIRMTYRKLGGKTVVTNILEDMVVAGEVKLIPPTCSTGKPKYILSK